MGNNNDQPSTECVESVTPVVRRDQTPGSAEQLLPQVYDELRRLARRQFRSERSDHTLQATALVHEAYFHLGDCQEVKWASRAHFFNAAAEAMRRILIEHARARNRPRRGGTCKRVPLDVLDLAAETDSQTIVSLDEAFSRLEEVYSDSAAVVRLRFYGGLSTVETAETLGISPSTVKRQWAFARAWLYSAMNA
jgi:RNA polymerase sigma-70 factor (ECF subfamily)